VRIRVCFARAALRVRNVARDTLARARISHTSSEKKIRGSSRDARRAHLSGDLRAGARTLHRGIGRRSSRRFSKRSRTGRIE
jgi:hypothetical protein